VKEIPANLLQVFPGRPLIWDVVHSEKMTFDAASLPQTVTMLESSSAQGFRKKRSQQRSERPAPPLDEPPALRPAARERRRSGPGKAGRKNRHRMNFSRAVRSGKKIDRIMLSYSAGDCFPECPSHVQ
jgi:hypothetical protein